MKKFIFILLTLLSINTCAFAGQDIIMSEQESQNAVTYVIAGQGYSCLKSFIKYVDSSNHEEYWIRLSTMFRDRLKPYVDMEIDGQAYRLWAFEEFKKRHLRSSSGTEGNFYNYEDFECYEVPKELIPKLANCKSMKMMATSQRRTEMKLVSNQYFLNGIKEIINLKYEDREPYYTNNEKVKIK